MSNENDQFSDDEINRNLLEDALRSDQSQQALLIKTVPSSEWGKYLLSLFKSRAGEATNEVTISWLVQQYAQGRLRLADLGAVKETLAMFKRYAARLEPDQRDLARYSSLAEVWEAVIGFKKIDSDLLEATLRSDQSQQALLIKTLPSAQWGKYLLSQFESWAGATTNTVTISWLVQQYAQGKLRLADLGAAEETLEMFKRYAPRLEPDRRDLARYSSLAEVWEAVIGFEGTEVNANAEQGDPNANARQGQMGSFQGGWGWDYFSPPKNPSTYPGVQGEIPTSLLMAHPEAEEIKGQEWFSRVSADARTPRTELELCTFMHDHNLQVEPCAGDISHKSSRYGLLFLGYFRPDGGQAWICQDALQVMAEEKRKSFLASWAQHNGMSVLLPDEFSWLHRAPHSGFKPLYEMTLQQFFRTHRPKVIASHNFSSFEIGILEEIERRIRDARPWRPQNSLRAPSGMRFFINEYRDCLALRRIENGELLGGISKGTTWVSPHYRGQGLGGVIVEAGHSLAMLNPSHFSVEGYRARLSAHKAAVARAIADGKVVPQHVLDEYVQAPDGALSFADPQWLDLVQQALDAPPNTYKQQLGLGRATKAERKQARGRKKRSSDSLIFLPDPDEFEKDDFLYSGRKSSIATLDEETLRRVEAEALGIRDHFLLSGTPQTSTPTQKANPLMSNKSVDRSNSSQGTLVPMAQPDAISCGATAASMVLKALGFLPSGGIADIQKLIRTNPQTGTIPWAVVEGLANIGVVAQHREDRTAKSSPDSYIWRLLEDREGKNYAMLRLLVGGHGKHWVVAEKLPNGQMSLIDPGNGAKIHGGFSSIVQDWVARNCEAITIPMNPAQHPAKAPPSDLTPASSGMIKPEENSLLDWLTHKTATPTLVSNAVYERDFVHDPKDFGRLLNELAQDPYLRPMKGIIGIKNKDAKFYVVGGPGYNESMVVRLNGRVVGGLLNGTNYVLPEYRRQGLGGDLLLTASQFPFFRFLKPTVYSENGYRARLSAHRRALMSALERGESVSTEILADYTPDFRLISSKWQEIVDHAGGLKSPVPVSYLSSEAYAAAVPPIGEEAERRGR